MKRNTPMHPKVQMLATMLGIRRFEAVGILEMLWHFTAQYAPQGDVGKRSDVQISAYLDWPVAESSNLINALVECGWLEKHPEHRLIVHDWDEHCDQACDKYLSDKGLKYATGRDTRRKNSENKYVSPDKSRLVATSNDSRAGARVSPCPLPIAYASPPSPPTGVEGDVWPTDVEVDSLREIPSLKYLTKEDLAFARYAFKDNPSQYAQIAGNGFLRHLRMRAAGIGSTIGKIRPWIVSQMNYYLLADSTEKEKSAAKRAADDGVSDELQSDTERVSMMIARKKAGLAP